ncbi:MAG: prepilin-type N-terminal cleavage/methylation domain-containing protein [Planctomycetota bacterium]
MKAPTRQGFTILEMLITIVVIGALLSIVLVGLDRVGVAATRAAGLQDVNAIKQGVTQFRDDFGFLPPVVADDARNRNGLADPPGSLIEPDNTLRVLNDNELRGIGINPDFRYSNHSIPLFVMGALDSDVDGANGLGFREPQVAEDFARFQRGSFSVTASYFEPRGGSDLVLQGSTSDSGRWVLLDRRGQPYRFYRWLPSLPAPLTLHDLNVPNLLGSAVDDATDPDNYSPALDQVQLRNAAFAIVSAGTDEVFGDRPLGGSATVSYPGEFETREQLESATDTAGLSDNELADRAREDNIIAVGGDE